MRTVSLRDYVLFGSADLLNITPDPDLAPDKARQMCRHLNSYVKKGWKFWRFPELTRTEERAFRTIWSADKTFLRASANGLPDELFYITDMTYYQVKADAPGDPPAGTLPTDANYFQALDPVDRYIAFDQTCRRSIDTVLGIYNGNPRVNVLAPGLNFRPSERGIDVALGSGPTVFMHYKTKPFQYTVEAYDPAKAYVRGNLAFYQGETYRARGITVGHAPTDATYWSLVPVPEILADYLKYAIAGELADDRQTKVDFLGQAEDFLADEADKLIAQGQVSRYNFASRSARAAVPLGVSGFWWSISPPFSGSGTITTLTETCDDDAEAVPEMVTSIDESGAIALVQDQDYIDVDFAIAKPSAAAWVPDRMQVVCSVEPPPDKIFVTTITKSATGFRAWLNAGPSDGTYTLDWKVKGA